MATPTTPLQRLANGGKITTTPPVPTSPDASPLRRAMAGGRRGELVTLPAIGSVRMELLGVLADQEVEAAVYRTMRDRGHELGVHNASLYEAERAVRTLAIAVVVAETGAPFGSLDDWNDLVDASVLNVAWQIYGDVRERLDPMSQPLTDTEAVAIQTAVKKKDGTLLRSFGIAKLSTWVLSTDGQLATSPIASSSSSGSASGS